MRRQVRLLSSRCTEQAGSLLTLKSSFLERMRHKKPACCTCNCNCSPKVVRPKVVLACMQKGLCSSSSCEMKAPGCQPVGAPGEKEGRGGTLLFSRPSRLLGLDRCQDATVTVNRKEIRDCSKAGASLPQFCRAWTWQEGETEEINPLFPSTCRGWNRRRGQSRAHASGGTNTTRRHGSLTQFALIDDDDDDEVSSRWAVPVNPVRSHQQS